MCCAWCVVSGASCVVRCVLYVVCYVLNVMCVRHVMGYVLCIVCGAFVCLRVVYRVVCCELRAVCCELGGLCCVFVLHDM